MSSAAVSLRPESHSLAIYAKALLASPDGIGAAREYAAYTNAPARVQNILKSAVDFATTTDTDWASALADYRIAVSAFVGSLANDSVFYRIAQTFVQVPLKSRVVISTSAAIGHVVGEGQVKQLTSLSFNPQGLAPQKAAATVVISAEVAKLQSEAALALINAELRKGVVNAVDGEFLAILRAAGASAIPSSGTTADGAVADLGALLSAVPTGAGSRLFLVMRSETAKKAALLRGDGGSMFPELGPQGGFILQMPVIVSDSPADGNSPAAHEVWLIDGSQIAGGSDTIVFDQARHATLQLDSAPDSPSLGSTVMQSLWQADLVALRSEAWFAAKPLRASAAAYLTDVNWA